MTNTLRLTALARQASRIDNIEQVIDLVAVASGTDGSLAALFLNPVEWKFLTQARRESQVQSFLEFSYIEAEHRASGTLVEVGAAA